MLNGTIIDVAGRAKKKQDPKRPKKQTPRQSNRARPCAAAKAAAAPGNKEPEAEQAAGKALADEAADTAPVKKKRGRPPGRKQAKPADMAVDDKEQADNAEEQPKEAAIAVVSKGMKNKKAIVLEEQVSDDVEEKVAAARLGRGAKRSRDVLAAPAGVASDRPARRKAS